MVANPLLHRIVSDERLTRGLGDAEARVLVEWLVEQTEQLLQTDQRESLEKAADWLCFRGRALAHFVRLWCLEKSRGSAGQLAAAERFVWPLPPTDIDPCELMQSIVAWEGDAFWQQRRSAVAA